MLSYQNESLLALLGIKKSPRKRKNVLSPLKKMPIIPKDFVLDSLKQDSKLQSYNFLEDKNLRYYLAKSHVKRNLLQTGLIRVNSQADSQAVEYNDDHDAIITTTITTNNNQYNTSLLINNRNGSISNIYTPDDQNIRSFYGEPEKPRALSTLKSRTNHRFDLSKEAISHEKTNNSVRYYKQKQNPNPSNIRVLGDIHSMSKLHDNPHNITTIATKSNGTDDLNNQGLPRIRKNHSVRLPEKVEREGGGIDGGGGKGELRIMKKDELSSVELKNFLESFKTRLLNQAKQRELETNNLQTVVELENLREEMSEDQGIWGEIRFD